MRVKTKTFSQKTRLRREAMRRLYRQKNGGNDLGEIAARNFEKEMQDLKENIMRARAKLEEPLDIFEEIDSSLNKSTDSITHDVRMKLMDHHNQIVDIYADLAKIALGDIQKLVRDYFNSES